MCRAHPLSLIRTDPMGCFATTPVGRLIRPHSGLLNTYTWRPVTAAIRPLPTPSKYPNSLDGPQAATRIVSPGSKNRLAHTVIFCSCRSALIVSSSVRLVLTGRFTGRGVTAAEHDQAALRWPERRP